MKQACQYTPINGVRIPQKAVFCYKKEHDYIIFFDFYMIPYK